MCSKLKIEHPTIPAFKELGLRWYAVPAISNFRLDIGGIVYACIPFNGWYMSTEIVRDLLEDQRYNQLEAIADVLGLDTSCEQTLWRDRVAPRDECGSYPFLPKGQSNYRGSSIGCPAVSCT